MTLRKVLAGLICFSLMLPMLVALPVQAAATSASVQDSKYEPLDPDKWELVWYDEFNGAAVDTGKWEFTIGGGGFGNNEQQYYTDSTDNAFIRDGCLVLKAIQGEYGGEDYTSAKLSSTESWKYGRFEFRAKLPDGAGLWPAIWMLPEDMDVYGSEWPICGEIDIMEYMGSDTDTVLGTLHYGNPWVYNTGYYDLENGGSFAAGYHDFAMEWLPGEIRWYVDGELYQIQQNWYSIDATGTYAYPAPFDQEFYLMLNLAVGGYFPGDPVPSDWTSTEFAIDYVRIYEYTGELVPAEQEGQAHNVNLLANPGFDADLSGWETWTENGSVFSCSEGCLKADVYTTLPNTWSTQFYQNVDVYSGTEYRLSFKVRSSVSRPVTVGLEGANNSSLFSATFTADSQWQTFTYDFIPTVGFSGAKLLFFLGNVTGATNAAHTLYFDDITLMPVADELVANGDFALSLDSWTTWTENGGSFAAPESEGCVTATLPTILPNTWSSQLYQDVNITEPGTYRLSFSAKASMPRQICVAVEKDGMAPPLNHTFDISGEWAEYSVEFTTAASIDQAKLVFMLGCVGSTQNLWHTVSIDNVSLYKIN